METELPGTLLGAGRNADVYDIGGGRVLRRYRDGRDPAAVDREAQVMAHARAHGVPVPEVFEVSGSDIVMERATGPTMLDVLGRRPWTLRSQARLLARLHGRSTRRPRCRDFARRCGDEDPDSQVLLHRDLHPMNVILTSTGPVIIDWEGAARGPAMLDVAMTWVIVAFSEVPESRARGGGRAGPAVAVHPLVRAGGGPDRPGLARHRRPPPATDPNVLPTERARLERLPHD